MLYSLSKRTNLELPFRESSRRAPRRLTWSDTSSKSARPAKDFESWETVSIAESAQCSLVQRLAQLLALNFSTPQHLNFYTMPVRLELGPVVSGRSGNADSSGGEF